jgi:MFS family permease
LFRFSKFERVLLLVFIFTLPLSNPWVRGDGVGYYAFARSLLIEHHLSFEKDWLAANTSFRMSKTDEEGRIVREQYTSTGHLNNHFTIGPALLWSPFLIAAHVAVLTYNRFGGRVPADGYSAPYIVMMALGTAIYGFLALWISFRVARKYVAERWAFLATIGIWFASSLPVYMYFNPSWSHAHSAFTVALFFWYWDRTRNARTLAQWVVLGLIAGLMMNVYYPCVVLVALPLLDSLFRNRRGLNAEGTLAEIRSVLGIAIFAVVIFVAFLPTLIEKKIIYGGYLNFGYTEQWYWRSPALLKVCFSAEHGLFSWTPILIPAVIGLYLLRRHDSKLAFYSLAGFAAYLYTIGCYENWHGLSSFGNRFFVSLAVLFVLGLASFFDWMEHVWQERRAIVLAASGTAIFIVWNLGLIFQWGMHLIPSRGPISWRDAAYNQFAVVPVQLTRTLESYLTRRKQLMRTIEQEDVKQLKSGQQ